MEPTGGDVAALGGDEALRLRIAELQREHRELDDSIQQLVLGGVCDELHVQRLKKRKLLLKDTITRLQMALVPDIPA